MKASMNQTLKQTLLASILVFGVSPAFAGTAVETCEGPLAEVQAKQVDVFRFDIQGGNAKKMAFSVTTLTQGGIKQVFSANYSGPSNGDATDHFEIKQPDTNLKINMQRAAGGGLKPGQFYALVTLTATADSVSSQVSGIMLCTVIGN